MMPVKNVAFLLIVSMLTTFCVAQQYTVATYNLRLYTKNDVGNLWEDRSPAVINLIRFHNFDVFGTQEGMLNQLNDISTALPEYARYGKGRDDGGTAGEHSAIFYKKSKYQLVDSGDFWLSQTPDKPSLGWDATCCHRICSWVQLKDKASGKSFYFFSAHFDHQGVVARKKSAELVLEKISAIAKNKPAIFCGDLNGGHTSEWYRTLAGSPLLTDTYTMAAQPYAPNGTFNGFNQAFKNTDIIDHIFVSNAFTVSKWGVLTDTYFGKFPSDHFPVMAVVSFKK